MLLRDEFSAYQWLIIFGLCAGKSADDLALIGIALTALE
jgi:hypothetical protein